MKSNTNNTKDSTSIHQERKTKIIVGGFYAATSRAVFCRVNKKVITIRMQYAFISFSFIE